MSRQAARGGGRESYTIGELAREFDVTLRTIRFYEDEGLLSPRRRGQARIFSPRDRIRLKLVLRGKRLGFSIGEIREIIDLYDRPPGEAGQLRLFLAKIAERCAALEQQRAEIGAALSELRQIERSCRARVRALGGKGAAS